MKTLSPVASYFALASLVGLSVGCGVQLRTSGFGSPGASSTASSSTPTASTSRRGARGDASVQDTQAQEQAQAARDQKAQDAKALRDQQAAQEAARQAARKDAAEALQAKANTMVTLPITELGLTIDAPGDVQYGPFDNKAYGDPALHLRGDASGFAVIVTDASKDTYGLEQRERQQQVDFTYGVTVIRGGATKNGWGIEYSDPVYSTMGERMGTEYGYFGRRIVGGKPYNCFHSGQSSPAETAKVIAACDSLKVSRSK